jgi:hypothetical protein
MSSSVLLTTGGVITLGASGGTSGVSSVNTLIGAITIESTDSSVSVSQVGQQIDLSVPAVPPIIAVNSLQGVSSDVLLTSVDGSVSYNPNVVSHTIDLAVNFPAPLEGVRTLNKLLNDINLVSLDGSVAIKTLPDSNEINLTTSVAPVEGVKLLNTLYGDVSIACPDGTLVIGADAGTNQVVLKSGLLTGIYVEVDGGDTAKITSAGITPKSVVIATLVQTTNGDPANYIVKIAPDTDMITIVFNKVLAVGDQINWLAYPQAS